MTRFCFDHLKEMIEQSKHDYDVMCVISEAEYINICNEYGFRWTYFENNPLGAKINHGIKQTLSSEWDYLMMMNSDNVIAVNLIDKYYDGLFKSGERFFGVNKVTYVNFETHEAREIDYGISVLGIAKCIRRDVVEMMRGELYPPHLNRCLDDNMFDRMVERRVFPKYMKYEGMLAMDFKSEVNIHPWEKFKDSGKVVDYAAIEDTARRAR